MMKSECNLHLLKQLVAAVATTKRDGYDKTVQPNLVMSLYPTFHVLRCPTVEERVDFRVKYKLVTFFSLSHGVRLSPLGTVVTVCPIVPAPDDR
jgi:hypothetical protein